MYLWNDIPFPFLEQTNLKEIRASFMPYNIMQGITEDGRAFLAQKIMYNNELRVGFIVEMVPNGNDWEYGVLERMDIWRNHI
jgi:hypothetical protein